MLQSQQLTILIIDDNALNLRLLEAILVRVGYRILKATGGKQGRTLAIEEQPDLIILDVFMPEEDGFTALAKLQENAVTQHIPVIFITSDEEKDSKIKGFELGAVDYILKPFSKAEVLARIKVHLRAAEATKALIMAQAEKLKQVQKAQESFLVKPKDLPEGQFGAYYNALLEAGGDFYDVIAVTETVFTYFVGDVAGHDIGTSFITASMKALLKQNTSILYEPSESMDLINQVLLDILPAEKYLTGVFARLSRAQNILTVSSGGHPPIIYIPRDAPPYLLECSGSPLGIFKNCQFDTVTTTTTPGDRFLLYSDGLIERGETAKVWSSATTDLFDYIDALRDIPIEDVPKTLNTLANQDKPPADDDIVIVAVEV